MQHLSVFLCSMVLSNPNPKVSALPKPASAPASASLSHIQGHSFHSSAAPLHHRFFFIFSWNSSIAMQKYCSVSISLILKEKKNFLWFSLPCQPLTYFFSPLCSQILKKVISALYLQFPLHYSTKVALNNSLAASVQWNCTFRGHLWPSLC